MVAMPTSDHPVSPPAATAEIALPGEAALSVAGTAGWLEVTSTPPDGRPVSFGHDAAHIFRDRFSGLRRRVTAGEVGTFWVMTLSVPFVVVRATVAPPSGVITLVWSDGASLETLLEQSLAVEDLDAWIEAFAQVAADPPRSGHRSWVEKLRWVRLGRRSPTRRWRTHRPRT